MRKLLSVTLLLGLSVLLATQLARAAEFKIGIMQDVPGAAKEYGPLIDLFKENGIEVKL